MAEERKRNKRDGDATQALRSPWSDCGKRERAIACAREREGGGGGGGGGDRVRKGIRRQGSKDRQNKAEESLSGAVTVPHRTFLPSAPPTPLRLLTSSPRWSFVNACY